MVDLASLFNPAQGANEPDGVHWLRNAYVTPWAHPGMIFNPALAALRGGFGAVGGDAFLDTPAARAARSAPAAAAPQVDPNAAMLQLFQQGGLLPSAAAPAAAPAAPSPFVGGGATGVLKNLETGSGSGVGAISRAGAMGPFQIMPKTGPEAAALAGETWDAKRALNDPAYSARLGTAYYDKQLRDFGGDPALAFGAYNAGPGRVKQLVQQHGDAWLAFAPKETQQYVLNGTQQLSGQVGGSTYNPAFDQLAMGEIDKATGASMTPTSVTFDRGQAPEMPAPIMPANTDFSKVNADLAAMKPVDEYSSAAAQRKVQWKGFFRGMSEALANVHDGEGLGTVLAKLGAGSLGGRAGAEDELEHRHQVFEDKLEQWQRASAANDLNQAQTAHSEAVGAANTMNEYAGRKWQAAFSQWLKDSQPQFVGDRVITSQVGADGKVTLHSTPMSLGAVASGAMAKAQLFTKMGDSAQQSATHAQATDMQMKLLGGLALGAAGGVDPKSSDAGGALFGSLAMRVQESLGAGVFANPDILPADMYESLNKQGDAFAQQQVPLTNTGANAEDTRLQAKQNFMVQQLTSYLMQVAKGGNMKPLTGVLGLGSPGAIAHGAALAARSAEMKTTMTRGRRGTSISQTGPSDAFGG